MREQSLDSHELNHACKQTKIDPNDNYASGKPAHHPEYRIRIRSGETNKHTHTSV